MKVTTKRLAFALALFCCTRCATARYVSLEEAQKAAEAARGQTATPPSPVSPLSNPGSKRRKRGGSPALGQPSQSTLQPDQDSAEAGLGAGGSTQGQGRTSGSAGAGEERRSPSPQSAYPATSSASLRGYKIQLPPSHLPPRSSGLGAWFPTESIFMPWSSPPQPLTQRKLSLSGVVVSEFEEPQEQYGAASSLPFSPKGYVGGASSPALSGKAVPTPALLGQANPFFPVQSATSDLGIQSPAPEPRESPQRQISTPTGNPAESGALQLASSSSSYVAVQGPQVKRSERIQRFRLSEEGMEEVQQLKTSAAQLLVAVPDYEAIRAVLQEAVVSQKRVAARKRRRKQPPEAVESAVDEVFPSGERVMMLNADRVPVALFNRGHLGSGHFGAVFKAGLDDGTLYAAKVPYSQIVPKPGATSAELEAGISSARADLVKTVRQELEVRDQLVAKGLTLTEVVEQYGLPLCQMILTLPENKATVVRRGSRLFVVSKEVMLLPLIDGSALNRLVQQKPTFLLQRAVAREAILALAKLHELGFAHGDVKLNNMMIDVHGIGHMLDMGSVRPLDSCVNEDDKYYLRLWAPELAKSQHALQQTCLQRGALDVWAMGLAIFEFVCFNQLPYNLSNLPSSFWARVEHLSQLRLSDFSAKDCTESDPAVMGIVAQFLNPNPVDRPELPRLVRSYPFFRQASGAASHPTRISTTQPYSHRK
uniref:non-specific serine/threonine protein kinase n=1 Tax=Hammondia hammondi TaxID=99158 RepID=A0A097IYU0_HAMHA|nr:rhoptry protein 16 [Hammondia hammondi]